MADKIPSPRLDDEIQALPVKERLEAQKLQAETRALERPRRKDPIFWRDLLGIVAVGGTVIYSAIKFVDYQQSKQRFEVTRDVITLVEKLHQDESDERESAAILLSAWGKHALPLLLRSVGAEREPGSSGLGRALELIGREKPSVVLGPLREEAQELFAAVIDGDREAVVPLMSHIVLLGDLASLGTRDASIGVLQGFSRGLSCGAGSAPADTDVSTVDRTAVCKHLEDSIEKLED